MAGNRGGQGQPHVEDTESLLGTRLSPPLLDFANLSLCGQGSTHVQDPTHPKTNHVQDLTHPKTTTFSLARSLQDGRAA